MKKLHGNLKPVLEKLKRHGATWSDIDEGWICADHKFEELQAMIPQKVLNGQLWEECERCGQEPVYLSLGGLCERCG